MAYSDLLAPVIVLPAQALMVWTAAAGLRRVPPRARATLHLRALGDARAVHPAARGGADRAQSPRPAVLAAEAGAWPRRSRDRGVRRRALGREGRRLADARRGGRVGGRRGAGPSPARCRRARRGPAGARGGSGTAGACGGGRLGSAAARGPAADLGGDPGVLASLRDRRAARPVPAARAVRRGAARGAEPALAGRGRRRAAPVPGRSTPMRGRSMPSSRNGSRLAPGWARRAARRSRWSSTAC